MTSWDMLPTGAKTCSAAAALILSGVFFGMTFAPWTGLYVFRDFPLGSDFERDADGSIWNTITPLGFWILALIPVAGVLYGAGWVWILCAVSKQHAARNSVFTASSDPL